MVENALYKDDRILQAAAVGIPDARLGELVVAIVSLKPAFRNGVSEKSVLERVTSRWVHSTEISLS